MKFNWDSGCEQQQQQKETCSLAEASGFRRPHHSGFHLSEFSGHRGLGKLPTPSSASGLMALSHQPELTSTSQFARCMGRDRWEE